MKKFFILFFILTFFPSSVTSDDAFLSLKKNKVNVRYGPGFDYEVKYIYRKRNLPLKIIDKKENFRKIIDHKKKSGWIHWTQLKKSKSHPFYTKIVLLVTLHLCDGKMWHM